jgi:hypothetical protein
MKLQIKSLLTQIQHQNAPADAEDQRPLRKVAVIAVVKNPYAGAFKSDLSEMINASSELGEKLAELAVEAMGPHPVESYGKGGIVGTAGEQEHANALLTSVFAEPLRSAIGGKAWIASFTKVAPAGVPIDVPLAYKDALYVRSHYDGMTVSIPEGPLPDEIAVIFCLANRGRLAARVGGLKQAEAVGEDGLV